MNFVLPGGGGAWGDILGTLSNQTDLQNALNAKANGLVALTPVNLTNQTSVTFNLPAGVQADYLRLDLNFISNTATGTGDAPIVQLADSGGVEATGYNSLCMVLRGGSSPLPLSQSTGCLFMNLGLGADSVTGIYEFFRITGNVWYGRFSGTNSATTSGHVVCFGFKTLSDVLTGFRVTTPTGTAQFDTGNIFASYRAI